MQNNINFVVSSTIVFNDFLDHLTAHVYQLVDTIDKVLRLSGLGFQPHLHIAVVVKKVVKNNIAL